MTNILLADNHKIVRHAIKMIIADNADFQVTGEADNAQSLLKHLEDKKVELLILDLNMPDKDGFELIEELKKNYPQLQIMVFSMYENESIVRQIIESGAQGYVLKSTEAEELVHAIKTVGSGRFYICMAIAEKLLKRVHLKTFKSQQQIASRTGNLSRRELEVLNLIAEGMTNSEIAEKLFTSKRTIDTHRQNLIEKTNTRNTATLIKYAIANGLLE